MPIRYERHITRDMLRAEPETLFVFGDNLRQAGLGGQAAECRGEPNAVGIPTKRWPSMSREAFFTDSNSDMSDFRAIAAPACARLADHLRAGGTIVWPEAGIGTGLARLEEKAPTIYDWIDRAHARLCIIADEASEPSALPCHAGEVER